MNIHKPFLALCLMLPPAVAQAESTVVLESFEDNIDNAETIKEEGRVKLSSYNGTGADDENRTEGKKSLRITISETAGWGQDFNVTLDENASKIVQAAFAKKELARYIVRYDMIFPDTGNASPDIDWMVCSGAINGFERGQLEANGGRYRIMSFPLDLLADEGLELDEGDPIVMRFTTNFGPKAGAFEPTAIHLDNIRLVDTYASAATKPKVTLINSFEKDSDIEKLVKWDNWGAASNYELKLHSKSGADDLTVTEGSKSLEIKIKRDGGWVPDYEINLSGTPVVDALLLPKEKRGRYVLRWDVTFEDTAANGNWNGNWQNYIIWLQNGAGNYALGRRENAQHTRSYNLVLDELDFPEPNPDDPENQASWIGVINQGAWTGQGMTMHIDNIRLIDTGSSSAAPSVPVISNYALDRTSSTINLRWNSSAGALYDVEESSDLKSWKAAGSGLAGQADSTAFSVKQDSLLGAKFFRVRAK